MKKIVFVLAAIITLSACTKKSSLINKEQVVTYKLKCRDCLIYIEDDKWNRTNDLERSKNQHFDVTGEWEYSFVNTKLDSIEARIYVGVFSPAQKISLEISESKYNRKTVYNENLGFGNDPLKDYEIEKKFKLILK